MSTTTAEPPPKAKDKAPAKPPEPKAPTATFWDPDNNTAVKVADEQQQSKFVAVQVYALVNGRTGCTAMPVHEIPLARAALGLTGDSLDVVPVWVECEDARRYMTRDELLSNMAVLRERYLRRPEGRGENDPPIDLYQQIYGADRDLRQHKVMRDMHALYMKFAKAKPPRQQRVRRMDEETGVATDYMVQLPPHLTAEEWESIIALANPVNELEEIEVES